MKKYGLLSLGLSLFFSTQACAVWMQGKSSDHASSGPPQCYWMENITGKFEWVATAVALGSAYDYEMCYQADSCDGGLGMSGGGCYKWANSAQAPRQPWPEPQSQD